MFPIVMLGPNRNDQWLAVRPRRPRGVGVVVPQLVGDPGVKVHRRLRALAPIADRNAHAHPSQDGQRRGEDVVGRRRETHAHRSQLESNQSLVPFAIQPGQPRQRAKVQSEDAAGGRDVEEPGGDGGRRIEPQTALSTISVHCAAGNDVRDSLASR